MSINANSRIIIEACGACKFLQKRCLDDCIFAPYFDSNEGTANFESVHRIFGANNICKLLTNMPIEKRADVVFTLCLEARARLQDPIYGCISEIYTLQNQVITLEAELSSLQAQVDTQQSPLDEFDSNIGSSQQAADQRTFTGAPVDGGDGEEFAREFPIP
ncbi:LOB domain-containing protein 30-like [Impatiens glandulifera]|uniref:LOB domain-containing protein 30-like n=1 Tax=Impatiens glandulifera TaxID=253017 RepID=UPI001FB0E4DA|nr:LOB domain-containing protein 30-like [Impatiens glandulifera]